MIVNTRTFNRSLLSSHRTKADNFGGIRRSQTMAEAEEVGKATVQELAQSGGLPPLRFIQREEDRPVDASLPTTQLPIIDLRRLLLPDSSSGDEAAKLRSALQSWGMFQVIGHEMSASFLDEVRNIARKFFQLSMGVKKKYRMKEDGDSMEGYGSERILTEDQILDWVDRLYLLVQPEYKRKLDLWPEEPKSFRDVLQEYTIKTSKVAEHVLRSIAMLLELNKDYFNNQFGDGADVFARFNYYPCCSRPDLVFGIKPHSDGSMITILLPDKDVEGLQVLKDGEWSRIPAIPHALLINLGDQMEIMSNGIFKSPVHRAVTNTEGDRISLVMFYALGPEKDLKPADELVDEQRPRLYRMMKTKEYLGVFMQKFLQGERAIDWAKT